MDNPIEQSIKQLTSSFYKATRGSGERAIQGTNLHKLQVDFAYMLDNIKRGPAYIVPKLISLANEFINNEVPKVLNIQK
jgi:hypothetical protein